MSEENQRLDEREVRLERLHELERQGVNPYPSKSKRTKTNKEVLNQFDELSQSQEKVFCVGRIRLMRKHGGSTFAQIEDESSMIQIYFKKDVLNERYTFLDHLDIGDIIQVEGTLFETKKGEKTIQVEDVELLTKTLRPLPDKWHGIKDKEERYRKRYLDLIMNKDTRELFRKKSEFVQHFREFYFKKGFIEVNNNVLESVPGGAEAAPFITHHNSLDIDLYLRISLELPLKRLIVGGYEKIFEIGPVFRNEGMSPQHLQEFTMLESYEAYEDYNHLMDFIEELYIYVVEKTFGTLKFQYKGKELDFSGPWPRLYYYELVKEYSGINLAEHSTVESLKKAISEKGIEIEFEEHAGLGRVIDQLYKKVARPHIFQPTLLINQPKAISPLSKVHSEFPDRVERVQVLIAGAEVGNAFSELNDPIDQKERFEEQARLREAGDDEAQMMDEEYVEALEYGLAPTAGFGVGIERLFMFCTDSESVRDVVFSPTMKPKENPKEKAVDENKELESISKEDVLKGETPIFMGSSVCNDFPHLRVGYGIMKNVNIEKTSSELEEEKKNSMLSVEEAKDLLENSPILEEYRKIYKGMGVNPKSKKPSPIALLDRVSQGKDLYNVNTLVDALNLIVMKYGYSFGAADLDKIEFPIMLRKAKKDETMLGIMEKEPSTLKETELVYADKEKVLCRSLNYRDSEYTKITEETKNVFITIDALETDNYPEVSEGVLKEACALIQKICGGDIVKTEML